MELLKNEETPADYRNLKQKIVNILREEEKNDSKASIIVMIFQEMEKDGKAGVVANNKYRLVARRDSIMHAIIDMLADLILDNVLVASDILYIASEVFDYVREKTLKKLEVLEK